MDSQEARCGPSALERVITAIVTEDGEPSAASREFSVGLNVLVIDSNQTQLQILARTLEQSCYYSVTTCTSGESALTLLGKKERRIDIVLCDTCLPDFDSFALLQYIGMEMNLPVIMMSENDANDIVMKSMHYGALCHVTKPLGMETLKILWQLVFWWNSKTGKASMTNEGSLENLKRKREGKKENDTERRDSSKSKKRRVVWDPELHTKFMEAMEELGGVDEAVPLKILKLMNNSDLTRAHIASHLQKYRLYLAKQKDAANQEKVDIQAPIGSQEASDVSSGVCNVFDSQVPGLPCHVLPPQSAMNFQPASIGVANTSMHNSAAVNLGIRHLVPQQLIRAQNNQISAASINRQATPESAWCPEPLGWHQNHFSPFAWTTEVQHSQLQNGISQASTQQSQYCELQNVVSQASLQQPQTVQNNAYHQESTDHPGLPRQDFSSGIHCFPESSYRPCLPRAAHPPEQLPWYDSISINGMSGLVGGGWHQTHFHPMQLASIGVLANTSMHNSAAINQSRDHLVAQQVIGEQNNQISAASTCREPWHTEESPSHYPIRQLVNEIQIIPTCGNQDSEIIEASMTNELENVDSSKSKKIRVVWTPELHKKFVDAVESLGGVEEAAPLKILELMDNRDLTRENVSSHLQKYRLNLGKSKAAENQKSAQEASNGSAGSCNAIDSQVPVLDNGVPPQSVMNSEPSSIGDANTGMHNFAAARAPSAQEASNDSQDCELVSAWD